MFVTGIDCETTGLEWEDGHKLVEVALVVYNADRTKRGAYVKRINPQRSISAGAFRVHGISLADVATAPEWKTVAPRVSDILRASSLIVAHNGLSFDIPFFNHELKAEGLPPITAPCFDTMVEARWATPNGKSPNLGELCFACGVDYDTEKAHGAEYDVEVMMASFFRAVDWGFFKPPILSAAKVAA